MIQTIFIVSLCYISGCLYTLRGNCPFLPQITFMRPQQFATLMTPLVTVPLVLYFNLSWYVVPVFMIGFFLSTVMGWGSLIDMGTSKVAGRPSHIDPLLDLIVGDYTTSRKWLWRYSRDYLGLFIRYLEFAVLFVPLGYLQGTSFGIISTIALAIMVPSFYSITNYGFKTYKDHDTTWIAEFLTGVLIMLLYMQML